MNLTRLKTKTARLLATGVVLAAALAACSSTGSNSSGNTADSGAIKISLIGTISSSAISLPDVDAGARAAVKRINASGGVNGRQIDLNICNDQGDPNVAASCARGAAQNHVSTVVGQTTLVGSSIIPILERSNIASIGVTDISPVDHQSRIAFPVLTSGIAYAGLGPAMESAKCTNLAAISPHAPGQDDGINWAFNYGSLKGQPVNKQSVPAGAVDVTSAVNAVLSQNARCVLLAGDTTSNPAMVNAIRKLQSRDVTIAVTPGATPPKALVNTNGQGDGVIAASMYYLSATGSPPRVRAIPRRS